MHEATHRIRRRAPAPSARRRDQRLPPDARPCAPEKAAPRRTRGWAYLPEPKCIANADRDKINGAARRRGARGFLSIVARKFANVDS